MQQKDYITLFISISAFLFAVMSFAIGFRQRGIEDRHSKRKLLTDIIADLHEVDLAHAQLRIDHPSSTDEKVVAMRRGYNGKRRYLANHGEYVAGLIPDLVTDIDCNSLARAFETNGDYDRAEAFFAQSVKLSPSNTLRIANLRGFARYNFYLGNTGVGRKLFEDATRVSLPASDSAKFYIADTYALWSRTEFECGFPDEAHRIRKNAIATATQITRKVMRDEMLGQIENDSSLKLLDKARAD